MTFQTNNVAINKDLRGHTLVLDLILCVHVCVWCCRRKHWQTGEDFVDRVVLIYSLMKCQSFSSALLTFSTPSQRVADWKPMFPSTRPMFQSRGVYWTHELLLYKHSLIRVHPGNIDLILGEYMSWSDAFNIPSVATTV